ncbi:MAG: hypothetical protein K2J70_07375, partial [Muribaculaceae bacterium]|nr:hypothetical protein [Muribaculaceae bacterium]
LNYDEQQAVNFIRQLLPADKQAAYTDDEILYVIDIMYDWYEKNGYLDLSMAVTDEEEADISKLTDYVRKEIARDGEVEMDPDDIDLIVKGELEYEESLEDFV